MTREKFCTYCGSDEHTTAYCPLRRKLYGFVTCLSMIVGMIGVLWIVEKF